MRIIVSFVLMLGLSSPYLHAQEATPTVEEIPSTTAESPETLIEGVSEDVAEPASTDETATDKKGKDKKTGSTHKDDERAKKDANKAEKKALKKQGKEAAKEEKDKGKAVEEQEKDALKAEKAKAKTLKKEEKQAKKEEKQTRKDKQATEREARKEEKSAKRAARRAEREKAGGKPANKLRSPGKAKDATAKGEQGESAETGAEKPATKKAWWKFWEDE